MTQNLTIGERVAWYRRRRGLSQDVLAGLVGRTDDWMGKVENNRIPLDRRSVIRLLADALDVSLGDLIGDPTLLDWNTDSGIYTIPARVNTAMELGDVQIALRLGPDLDTSALPVERRVRHQLEVARAFNLAGRQQDSVSVVLDAEQVALEQVQHHYLSRQLVLTWMRNAHGSPPFALQALAQRMQIVR